MKLTKPGLYPDVDMPAYLAVKAVSSGLIHTLLTKSPLHAWFDSPFNPKREPRDSKEMDRGTYAHACLLEGGHGHLEIVDGENWTKKATHNGVEQAAHKHRTEIRARGKLAILKHEVAEVDAMVAEAKRFVAKSEIAGAFATGAAEQTIAWLEGETWCKARPDWIGDRFLVHYKTTAGSANPEPFGRMMENMGYDVALAFYDRGIREATGNRYISVILAQEQSPPYSCSLHALSPALADLAHRKVERGIAEWSACAKGGLWPAYAGRIHWQEPTPWAMAREDEREVDTMFSNEELTGGIPL